MEKGSLLCIENGGRHDEPKWFYKDLHIEYVNFGFNPREHL